MDFKTLSPAYLTSLGAIFCGALLIGSSTPWVLWLGWILLIAALCLNVLAVLLSVGKAKGNPVPALVTNLDGLESSVETRIRERAEHRREARGRREEEDAHAAEQPSEAHEQEAEPAQPETAQDEPREEEPPSLSRSCRPPLVAWVCCLLVPARLAVPRSPARTFARWGL